MFRDVVKEDADETGFAEAVPPSSDLARQSVVCGVALLLRDHLKRLYSITYVSSSWLPLTQADYRSVAMRSSPNSSSARSLRWAIVYASSVCSLRSILTPFSPGHDSPLRCSCCPRLRQLRAHAVRDQEDGDGGGPRRPAGYGAPFLVALSLSDPFAYSLLQYIAMIQDDGTIGAIDELDADEDA